MSSVPEFGFGFLQGIDLLNLHLSSTRNIKENRKVTNNPSAPFYHGNPSIQPQSFSFSSLEMNNKKNSCESSNYIEELIGTKVKIKEKIIDLDDDQHPSLLINNSSSLQTSSMSTKESTNFGGDVEGMNLSMKMHNDTRDFNPYKLPTRAIVYDYTRQPIEIVERKRIFLSHLLTVNIPFLRPIIIDGIGLMKAYFNCCPDSDFSFPLFPLIRCLFYWISKGHLTCVCFPVNFNPLCNKRFNADSNDILVIEKLLKYKLVELFDTDNNQYWYFQKLDLMRACLISTVRHWLRGLPSSLDEDDYIPSRRDHRPDRFLQPFFGHKGNLVFFSSFSSKGLCVADMILHDRISSQEDFDCHDKNQLSFKDQAKMLRCLYDHLPKGSRSREAYVMVEIVKRLKNFL